MKFLHRGRSFSQLKRLTEVKKKPEWVEPIGSKSDISIYNPITKSKVPFITKYQDFATWYMCGPTVYDSAHIGHACSYVKFDCIRRIISQHFGINCVTVMGITDIDDKIIAKSKETGRDWRELTKFYENEFFDDMDSLNVERPYYSCRVSENIPRILNFVEAIVKKEMAYVGSDGSVYFDTTKYSKYGKLIAPEAASSHPDKRSSLDFALWKAAKKGEPSWESSWGAGRPGWHIECSAMASAVFGNSMDIHSGGIDLAFPHHENEEAQSCCHHGVEQWVNYWLHSGHLNLKNVKMSKSLQNTLSITELLQLYTANQFRLYCLLSHYRSGVEFTNETIEAAVQLSKKITFFLNDCHDYITGTLPTGAVDESALLQALNATKNNVHLAFADDFDTPKVIHHLNDLIAVGNKMLHEKESLSKSRCPAAVAAVAKYISSTLETLGISHVEKSAHKNDKKFVEILDEFVKFRSQVRNRSLEKEEKDKTILKACDEARQNLSFCGINIQDRGKTSTWSIGTQTQVKSK